VPSRRELHDQPITTHHSYAFSTFKEGYWCGGLSNQNQNPMSYLDDDVQICAILAQGLRDSPFDLWSEGPQSSLFFEVGG